MIAAGVSLWTIVRVYANAMGALVLAALLSESRQRVLWSMRGDLASYHHAASWAMQFVSLGMLVFAIGDFVFRSLLMWQLLHGYRDACGRCGGPVSSVRARRIGPYVHCYQCGRNMAVRRPVN